MHATHDHEAMRDRLAARIRELLRRDAALQRHLRGLDGRLEQDSADRAAYTEMDEVLERLDDATRDELAALRATLERLNRGQFGTCSRCGDPIGTRRLEALPHTSHCVSCAELTQG